MNKNWDIDVKVGEIPEKFTSAITQLTGATYEPIAYLGSNDNNHAILAVQHETIEEDEPTNVVLMTFTENKEDEYLINVKKVLKGSYCEDGIIIDVDKDLPTDANDSFNKALHDFVGSDVKPFALLATQISDRIKFYFAVELTKEAEVPVKHVSIVTIDSADGTVWFKDIL